MDLTQNITPYDVRVAIAGDDADWTDCDPFNDEHPSDQLASSFVDGAIGVLSQVPR
jgi:hypothetical protein